MPKPTLSRCLAAVPALTLTLFFGWAAWERFRLPLTPFTNGDVGAYLMPGLSKLLGEGFRHWFGQCFLYPGFLYVVLQLGGDFRGITGIQNLFGLGTGALLYACWGQFRRFLPTPALPPTAHKLLGVLLVGVYLFSTATVEFARMLRPEAIFPFFAVLDIYCNLRFIRHRFLDGHPRRSLASGGAAVFVSVVASLLKPSFSPMLLLANLPVLISLFRPGQSARDKTLLVGLPILAAATLLLWPEWQLRRTDRWGALFLARTLFAIHADLINAQITEDLARHATTPYPPEFLAAMHSALTDALRHTRDKRTNYFPVLGFNADALIHRNQSPVSGVLDQLGGDAQTTAFCHYYYWRVIRQHPLWMAGKIVRQGRIFYRFDDCPAYFADPSDSLSTDYQGSADILANFELLPRYPPGAAFIAHTAALQTSAMRIGPYPWTTRISRLLAATQLPWCLWAVVLGGCAWANVGPCRRAFGAAAPVLLLLYSYNFGTVLAVAVGHSLDITRYSQYQLAYTLLAEFASISLALECLAGVVPGPAGRKPMKSRWMPKPPFGKGVTGLPGLVRGSVPPSVGIIILAGASTGEEYRTAFPDALILPAGGNILDVPDEADRDALLLIDADAGHSVAAAHAIKEAYATAPADLIIGSRGTSRGAVAILSRAVMWSVFGRSPADPFSGAWLGSRRFHRNVPLLSYQDTGALQLAWMVQAFDQGFSIRETQLPDAPGRAADRSWSFRADARRLRELLGWSVRCRPLKTFSALGVALLLLGGWLGYAPLRDADKKKHHAGPLRVMAVPVLLVAGLLGIQTGLLLDGMARRRREECQLRVRGNSEGN